MPNKLFFTKQLALSLSFIIFLGSSLSSCKQPVEEPGEVVIDEHNSVPKLLERKHPGPKEEQNQVTQTYNSAITALQANPNDMKQYVALASVFINEGRVTGNTFYYSNAALKMLNRITDSTVSKKDILFEGLSLKSAVLLNMHQFKQALAVAQQGKQLNDVNAGIHGALVDAHVEMGQYKEAVGDCDKMLSIRPDLRSYSRASYLRQIHGDNQGAIDAMKMAVEAGVPGLEATEWARVTWADLYFNIGKLDTAKMIYESSLSYRPGYPYAEMGLAKIDAARMNYDQAIVHTRNAIKQLSEASFVAYLGDLYTLKGDQKKASKVHKDLVLLLEQGEREQSAKALVQHNGHRELAQAYLNVGDYDKAWTHANADYAMRPNNIDANELMAWVLYLKGDYVGAKPYIDKVFVTKMKNANQTFKAGLIYTAAGDPQKGNRLKSEALAISPFIDPKLTTAAKAL